MNIFRQLRWKMTLSYTLVTVGAFLVITLILGGIVFTQIFVPEDSINPEQMIDGYLNSKIPSNYLTWSQILSQSPVDQKLVELYLKDSQSIINSEELFRIGAIRFLASTNATIRVLIFRADGILLGTSVPDDPILGPAIGYPFDPTQVPGLEAPLKAALAGDTDPKQLYTMLVPNQRYVMAVPVFNRAYGHENQVVGVISVIFDSFPTQADVPAHVLRVAGRGLIIFLVGIGMMGALFGVIFSHGLDKRFKQISATTDLWSAGDFSHYINDTTGDEISQFVRRLNNMAKQLLSLLRRRQDMAISEERNRLARDLHDSAKQQALAASFELGTALTLFERNPDGAKKHLVEADVLVDSVRNELTNLVDELRPQPIDDKDFASVLKEHALDWSHRSGIEINLDIEEYELIPLALRETLYRILQEALANIARHSSATCAHIYLQHGTNTVTMTVTDNGTGFDTNTNYSGIGLNSMRERAEVLDGHFTIESAPGQGTQIKVTMPLRL